MASFSLLSFTPSLSTYKPASCCLSVNQVDPTLSSSQTLIDVPRVVFAAGSTGGHIYPAVAIADALKLSNPASLVLFLGAPNSMESKAVPTAGHSFAAVAAAGHPLRLLTSLLWTLRKLADFDPDVVVATGGYVSLPVGLAAALRRRVKLVVQEQNAVPGLANWLLSFLADVVFVAFDSTVEGFPKSARRKCVVCGNPVRLSLRQTNNVAKKKAAVARFFPEFEDEGSPKVVLVLGGSLGANAINIALLNMYYEMLLEKEELFIIWQTGVEAYNEMESLVRNHPRLLLKPFMHKMDLAYAAADLVVSRAGAMTCYELLATGKPAILIPSPDADEGHQFKNAALMSDLAGSRVITEDELDSTTLGNAIEEILGDESKMAEMSERALKAANVNASEQIVHHVLSLANLSRSKKTCSWFIYSTEDQRRKHTS